MSKVTITIEDYEIDEIVANGQTFTATGEAPPEPEPEEPDKPAGATEPGTGLPVQPFASHVLEEGDQISLAGCETDTKWDAIFGRSYKRTTWYDTWIHRPDDNDLCLSVNTDDINEKLLLVKSSSSARYNAVVLARDNGDGTATVMGQQYAVPDQGSVTAPADDGKILVIWSAINTDGSTRVSVRVWEG